MPFLYTIFVFFVLYQTLKYPHAPSDFLNVIRGIKGLFVAVLMSSWSLVVDGDLPFVVDLTVIFVVWVVTWRYGVTVKVEGLKKLTLTPSHEINEYHVHLLNLSQPFDRATYQELGHLIDELPRLGVRSLVLTSPLLAKDGDFRSLARLNAFPVRIKKSTNSYFFAPLEFLVLCYYKYVKRERALLSADLSRQYRLRLTLPHAL